MEFGRIYIIKNTINDKVYVGQTTQSVRLRFLNHLSAARKGKDYRIGQAIRKYGEANFYVETLEECLKSELNERECYYIKLFNSTNSKFGYNISVGGHKVTPPVQIDSEKVLELFKQGYSAWNISKILHTHIKNVTPILQTNNLVYGQEKQRITKNTQSMIIDLYLLGYGVMQICRELNVDKGTVRKYLTKNNIKLRTRKETTELRRNLLTLNKVPHESLATQTSHLG